MKIVVLGGGLSSERQVSLVSATSVCRALRSLGHKAVFVDMFYGLENYDGEIDAVFDAPDGLCGEVSIGKTAPDIQAVIAARKLKSKSRIGTGVLDVCEKADCVFLGLHGADGEDGKIQAVLELMGVPYTGSAPLGSAMAMDKIVAKKIMESCGVPTPAWKEINCSSEADIQRLVSELSVPCVLKAVDGGSSLGVALPDTADELEAALRSVSSYGNRILVEEKINGREFTVPVFGDKYLNPIEIVPPGDGSFDFVSKYQGGAEAAREICPADISDTIKEKLGNFALKFHKALGLSVYSRSDFIMDTHGNIFCLEVNTLPGMTPASLIPRSAAVEGIDYPHLCEQIVLMSLKERNKS